MRGQRKNPRKAVQPFENKKRKIDIFKNYEANGVEKIQRKLEIFSTLISKKSTLRIIYPPHPPTPLQHQLLESSSIPLPIHDGILNKFKEAL